MRLRPRFLVFAASPLTGALVTAILVATQHGCGNGTVPDDAGLGVCPKCPPPCGPAQGCPDDRYRDDAIRRLDCSEQNGVDTLLINSFDNYCPASGYLSGQDLVMYTDGTTSNFYVELNPNGIASTEHAGYQPAVLQMQLCAPIPALGTTTCQAPGLAQAPTPGVLHLFGGTFLSWGGGFGFGMAKLNGRDPIINGGTTNNTDQNPTSDPRAPKNNCCFQDGNPVAMSGANGPPCRTNPDPKYAGVCPPADAEFAVYVGALDVSAYEGISFWGRRGPSSQMGIRVLVGDKYTDDDLNYLALRQQAQTGQTQPTYCRRNRECSCRLDQTCTFYTKDQLNSPVPLGFLYDGNYCTKPKFGPQMYASPFACGVLLGDGGAMSATTTSGSTASGFGPSNCCLTTSCNDIYAAYPVDLLPATGRFLTNGGAGQQGDPQFYGKPCTPYAYQNGVSGSFCFDPATETPAPSTEQCGDFWTRTVDLSTDWHFYMVPFTDMRQQGWAKKSEFLDLHSVSVVRFTWDIGNIDYWIDDVSFYRHKTD
jgi:hypothetical protein